MSEMLLTGRGLSVSYGGVKAVQNVDLEIRSGEVVGLIGPNGAGKTSLMDGITGFAPLAGSLTLKGREINGMRAHLRRRAGVSRTWQSVGIFDDLTVAENVAMAATGVRASENVRIALERARDSRMSRIGCPANSPTANGFSWASPGRASATPTSS